MDTAPNTNGAPDLIALKDVTFRASISRSQVWRLAQLGKFPKPAVVLGTRFTRWRTADVDAWLRSPNEWIAAHAPQPEEVAQ